MLRLEAGSAALGHIVADVGEVEAESLPAGEIIGMGEHRLVYALLIAPKERVAIASVRCRHHLEAGSRRLSTMM